MQDSSPTGIRDRWITIVVLIVGVAVTLGAFSAVRHRERERELAEANARQRRVIQTVQFGFQAPLEVLYSIPALFDASEDVSRDEFRRFTRRALDRRDWIYALEWFPLVRGEDREAYERAAREDGLPDFEFRDPGPSGGMVRAPDRPEHIPLYYIEPPIPAVLGFDLAGRASFRGNFDRARDQGRAVLGDRNLLVEAPELGFFVAVYHPVYRRGTPLETVEERRDAVQGAAVLMLLIERVMNEALAGIDFTRMQLILVDEDAPEDMRLLYERPQGAPASLAEAGNEALSVSFPVADRTWSLEVAIEPIPLWAAGSLGWVVLLTGLSFTAAAAYGFRLVLRLRSRVREALELGQYTLGKPLGSGGMGIVYEARHRMLKRPAAIKLIRTDALGRGSADGGSLLRRFEREARATAALHSPHTISIYDFGRHVDGPFYYVMELLAGLDARTLVERFGPLPAPRVLHLLRQVCLSLEEAHHEGLIHRDVKPANIYVCRQGLEFDFVKVLDFGLVKPFRKDAADAGVTRHDAAVGTPSVMPPEAYDGKGRLDPRSDLYAVGCVGYWLLTGASVFEGKTVMAVAAAHLTQDPAPPSRRAPVPVPEALDAAILRCLAKDPEDRPRDAAALIGLLEACPGYGEWDGARARDWWTAHLPEYTR